MHEERILKISVNLLQTLIVINQQLRYVSKILCVEDDQELKKVNLSFSCMKEFVVPVSSRG